MLDGETGNDPDPAFNRVFSQNERSEAEFDNTLSVRRLKHIPLKDFLQENLRLPRQTLKDLDSGTSQNPKHEMAHHLNRAAYADKQGAEVVFELRIDPLRSGALFESLGGGWIHGDFFAPARIGIDDGNVTYLTTKGVNFFGVVSGIHQIVETGNPLLAHLGQWDGHLKVVERSGGQNRTDRNVSIDDIQVEFVTDPGFLETLRVAFDASVTENWQICQVFGEGTLWLEFQASEFLRLNDLAFGRATSFFPGFGFRNRFGGGLFSDGNSRGVPTDMTNEFGATTFVNHGSMNFFRQTGLCEGGKGTGKGGFGGDLRFGVPTTEASQGRGVFQVIQESAGGRKIPDCFGDEGLGQRQTIFRFATDERPLKRRHETLRMAEFDDLNELLLLLGKGTDFFFQHGEELGLDDEGSCDEVAHKKTPKKVLTNGDF